MAYYVSFYKDRLVGWATSVSLILLLTVSCCEPKSSRTCGDLDLAAAATTSSSIMTFNRLPNRRISNLISTYPPVSSGAAPPSPQVLPGGDVASPHVPAQVYPLVACSPRSVT